MSLQEGLKRVPSALHQITTLNACSYVSFQPERR